MLNVVSFFLLSLLIGLNKSDSSSDSSDSSDGNDEFNDPILCIPLDIPVYQELFEVINRDEIYNTASEAARVFKFRQFSGINDAIYNESIRDAMDAVIQQAEYDDYRFWLVDDNGRVIYYSNGGPENTLTRARAANNEDRIRENYNTRTEVINAQLNECGYGYRRDQRTNQRSSYLAARLDGIQYFNVGTLRMVKRERCAFDQDDCDVVNDDDDDRAANSSNNSNNMSKGLKMGLIISGCIIFMIVLIIGLGLYYTKKYRGVKQSQGIINEVIVGQMHKIKSQSEKVEENDENQTQTVN